MKAVCVLESILRKKDEADFSTIASYFNKNIEVIVKCSESPQSSLREKANKVPIVLIYLLLGFVVGGKPILDFLQSLCSGNVF